MRVTMLAGSGLSLLLACTVAATAQQRSTTCADRTQQVKKAQDQLAVLVPQVTAQKVRCTSAADDRRRQECTAYGVSLTLQRKQESDLKALTDDPAWRACSASAGGGTRYTPASVTPNSSPNPGGGQTNSGQNSPSTMGQGPGGVGGQTGSGTPGTGATRGFGPGSSGSGGMQTASTSSGNCGFSGCAGAATKSTDRNINRSGHINRNGPGRVTAPIHGRPTGSHMGRFPSTHRVAQAGRSPFHGRRR
jgi:hypothetical protein